MSAEVTGDNLTIIFPRSGRSDWGALNEIWDVSHDFFTQRASVDEVIIDVSGVHAIDSLGLNHIFMLSGYTANRQGRFSIVGASDFMVEAFKILGLDKKMIINGVQEI